MKEFFSKLWTYIGEFLLSILIVVGFSICFGIHNIVTFIGKTNDEWFSLAGQVLFPASVAIWVTYTNIAQSKFGDYLTYCKQEKYFHLAFIAPMCVQLITTIVIILNKGIINDYLKLIAGVLICYSLINLLTMIRNVTIFVKLYRKFLAEVDSQNKQS